MDETAPQKSHSELMAEFRAVEAEAYVAARCQSKRSMFLTPYTPDQLREMGAKIYLTDDNVGFALTPDGDMIGVFNNSNRRGAGQEAVILAIAEGAKTLDCIGKYLKEYYEYFGFVEKERVKWDDEQAPDGWEYSVGGRPDVIFLEYPDNLGREPSDVARRFELARNRGTSGGVLFPGRDSGFDTKDSERTRSGTLLDGEEIQSGSTGISPDDVSDGLSRDPDDVRARAEFARIEQAAGGELIDWTNIEHYDEAGKEIRSGLFEEAPEVFPRGTGIHPELLEGTAPEDGGGSFLQGGGELLSRCLSRRICRRFCMRWDTFSCRIYLTSQGETALMRA